MALKGVRVIEMAGLAPAPLCGMMMADFGAKVIRVDKVKAPGFGDDTLARGKQSIAVDLKQPQGVELVRRLCKNADVLLEPFRAGVMEKLGLGPELLLKENPRLVYARLTGYGQTGTMAQQAGHDINYLATSGVLSMLGPADGNPNPPINLLADFAGGSLACTLGIVMALYEREQSGRGQVVDASMVEGAAYIGSFLWRAQYSKMPIFGQSRGKNLLDGGAPFYNTYETKDGLYMAVGSLEPQFYSLLIKGLGLSEEEMPQYSDFDEMRKKFTEIFKSKTQAEWTAIFNNTDACVTPILSQNQAENNEHNRQRKSFIRNAMGGAEPAPAPVLSRTPGHVTSTTNPSAGEHTDKVLEDIGLSATEIKQLKSDGVVKHTPPSKL